MKTRETLPSVSGLRILKLLRSNGKELSFNAIKTVLDLTDGNLASVSIKLVRDGLVLKKKQFQGNYPLTTYRLSSKGLSTINAIIQEFSEVFTERLEEK